MTGECMRAHTQVAELLWKKANGLKLNLNTYAIFLGDELSLVGVL